MSGNRLRIARVAAIIYGPSRITIITVIIVLYGGGRCATQTAQPPASCRHSSATISCLTGFDSLCPHYDKTTELQS